MQVNLMEFVKMSTARDFRINSATVQARLEESAEASGSAVRHIFVIYPGVYTIVFFSYAVLCVPESEYTIVDFL